MPQDDVSSQVLTTHKVWRKVLFEHFQLPSQALERLYFHFAQWCYASAVASRCLGHEEACMAGKRVLIWRLMLFYYLLLLLIAVTSKCCALLLPLLNMMPSLRQSQLVWIWCNTNPTPARRLSHLKTFTWQNLNPAKRPRSGILHLGESPHLSSKRDQVKMRDYIDRWVTSPTWSPLGFLHP